MGLLGTLGGVVLLSIGAVLLYYGGKALRRYLNFRNLERKEGRAVDDGDLVGLEGKVVDAGSLAAPFTGKPCVGYVWKEERWAHQGSGDTEDWVTVNQGGELAEFTLETLDGVTVTVKRPDELAPQGHMHAKRLDTVEEVAPDDDPPEQIQRLVREGMLEGPEETLGSTLDDATTGGRTVGTRRYAEKRIEEGDQLYAYGTAEKAGGALTLRQGPLFALSNAPKDEMTMGTLAAVLLLGMLGGLFVLLGVGLLV